MLAAGLNSEGMHVGQLVPCCGATCIFNLSGLLGSSSKHAAHCRVGRCTRGTSGPVSSPSKLVGLGKVDSHSLPSVQRTVGLLAFL